MSAKPLMVQGTMSGAGKSLLVAGLCRVLAQDGYRVAPFKSQNMALNSFITNDGFEMGRAQVVQAQAAGVEPDVRMNPVLLKPTNDVGSQVIVNGEVLANMSAREYFAFKKALIPQIMEAYDGLASEYDFIIIEGAGSPAEVNLKDDDIVNMGMAALVDAPVLLVGDIDRGGVFAQLIGTVDLLEPDERARVKGLVVNKFRGDKTILDPGLDILYDKTGIPVAGVIPYTVLDIDDEDSLSERLTRNEVSAVVDIAIIRLPRVSNFTDFISLEAIQGVGVRYVRNAAELGEPDLIILPGTKSTLSDLVWLRESGLEASILKRAAAQTPVFGICGGYQMLGKELSDPLGAEGGGSMRGMGLLPVKTVFDAHKHQVRSAGKMLSVEGALSELSGAALEGYEIHMGSTVLAGAKPLCELHTDDGVHVDGCQEGNVYGTYLHGVFDTTECAQALVSALLSRKGLESSALTAIDMHAYRESQYDKLADVVRQNMDMDLVYNLLGVAGRKR